LLEDYQPLMEQVVNGHTVTISAMAQAVLADFNEKYLLFVDTDFTKQWIPNEKIKDVDARKDLAKKIYDGATLERLGANGGIAAFYYPNRDIEKSYVMVLNGVQGGVKVYEMNADTTAGAFKYDVDKLGIHEIKYNGESKRFKLAANRSTKDGKSEIAGYIGYNGFGKVIVKPAMDKDGVLDVMVRLDENAAILSGNVITNAGLGNLTIEQLEDIKLMRVYKGFD